MNEDGPPVLNQLKFIVSDLTATVAFYRRLGLTVETGPHAGHATARLSGGVDLEWDQTAVVRHWDTGWTGETGGSTILGFSVPSRQAVDALYAELVAHGYRGHQAPYDAFWGRRLAIVDDPDANPVGIMSPIDSALTHWPPRTPPGDTPWPTAAP